MRANAFALPTAFEGLAALQAQARLDLVSALRRWLHQGHGLPQTSIPSSPHRAVSPLPCIPSGYSTTANALQHRASAAVYLVSREAQGHAGTDERYSGDRRWAELARIVTIIAMVLLSVT